MKKRILPAVFLLILATCARAEVSSVDLEWKDDARNDRSVPVKIWFDKAAVQKAPDVSIPIIVFSHGLGGSREGYAMWSSEWAAHGYLVINPTHLGSDTAVLLKGGIQGLRGAINMQSATDRMNDVHFVIDQAERMDAGTLTSPELAPFKGKLDLKHIGMAGHSFGSQTTLAIAGESFHALGKSTTSVDKRVTAAIAMSPQPALQLDQSAAFGSITIPMLHLTGTEDGAIPGITDVKPEQRRIPYDHSKDEAFLIIFKGATHMTFAPLDGTRIPAGMRHANDAAYAAIHEMVKKTTTQFWDAYLKGKPEAKAWLKTEMQKAVGELGIVEEREAQK